MLRIPNTSLHGDSHRPSCLCLGYSQQVLKACLIFDLSLGAPDSDSRGRPSNPSGGPVYAPSRFLRRQAPILPCDGRKSCGGCFLSHWVRLFRRGPLRCGFVSGIRNILSEVTAIVGSVCYGVYINIGGSSGCRPFHILPLLLPLLPLHLLARLRHNTFSSGEICRGIFHPPARCR